MQKKIAVYFAFLAVAVISLSACGKNDDKNYNTGLNEIKAGNYYSAIDAFTEVIGNKNTSEKDLISAYLYTAEANLKLKQTDEAIAAYKKAIEYDKNNTRLMIVLGEVLEAGGKSEEAINYYEQAVSLGDNTALTYVGAAYMNKDCYEEAQSVFERCIKNDIIDARTYYYLSKCCYELNDIKNALEYAQKAIKLKDSNYSDLLNYQLAVIYEDKGDWNKALGYMEKYVKEYPNDEEAKAEYTFIQTRVN